MKSEAKILWACPKCGRQFERRGQSHSCRAFPLEQHFKGKPVGQFLYEKLKQAVEKQVGVFKIESLECCIHFVGTCTFLGVKIFRDKIQVDFSLNHPMESERAARFVRMSANRYYYHVNLKTEDEMDAELKQWVQEAHELTAGSLVHG